MRLPVWTRPALAMVATVFAAPAAFAQSPSIQLAPIERFTLANGLEVAVLPTPGAPEAAVHVWYRVGSKEEARDRRGSAHMFEHIMFKGSNRVPPEAHARALNAIGGYVNAETSEDSTHYMNVVPVTGIEFALELEAERMRHLLFRDDVVATEKEVVKEEIRQQENSPITVGYLQFLAAAFKVHPYAWTAGGTIADLDRTTTGDLKQFYDTYYVPNNALVVVVGDVQAATVRASVEKVFGAIPRGTQVLPRPAALAAEPSQTAERREIAAPSQLGVVLVGYKIPEAKHPDIYALQLASIILGNGESSRLKQRIARAPKPGQPALGVEAGTLARVLEHPGVLIALGVFVDGANAKPVEAALREVIEGFGTKGPSKDELRKAKNLVQSSFVFSLDDADGLARQIGVSWILTGSVDQWRRDVEQLEKVTAADIQRVAKQYFQPTNATVVVIPTVGSKP